MSLYLHLSQIKDKILAAECIEDLQSHQKQCNIRVTDHSLARLVLKVWGLRHHRFSMMLIGPDISFYLKNTDPEDFKLFIDLRFRLYFSKIVKGWHQNTLDTSMKGFVSFQRQTDDQSLIDFFEEGFKFLFKTARSHSIVKIDCSNGMLILSGYFFHIMQLFDSLHMSPPVRDLNHLSQLRMSQIIFYEEEIKRAKDSGTSPEVLQWKETCENRLIQVNQGMVFFP